MLPHMEEYAGEQRSLSSEIMQEDARMGNHLVSIGRAAETLGVSKDTIRRLLIKGDLKSVRVARRVMLPQSEIDRACTQGVGNDPKRRM